MVPGSGKSIAWQPLEGAAGEGDAVRQRDEQAISMCKALLDSWSSEARATVEVITGGVTNVLFKVTNLDLEEGSKERDVILRVFGDNTDLLIDRQKELSVMLQLNGHGFGAKILATFENGRIEEYLTSKPMDYTRCVQPKYISKIAKLAAKFHSLPIDAPKEPSLWRTVWEWFDTACELEFQDPTKKAAFEKVDFQALKSELKRCQEMCRRIDPAIVWVHSDLLPGNIMLDPVTDAMTFIDFEYSTYGYQGFDIGNHWCECMGLELKAELFPSVEVRRSFVRAYLEAWKGMKGQEEKVEDGDVEKLLLEGEFFVVISHIFWCAWAIIQARYSTIDFGYFEYFEQRWAFYQQIMPETFAKLEASFGGAA